MNILKRSKLEFYKFCILQRMKKYSNLEKEKIFIAVDLTINHYTSSFGDPYHQRVSGFCQAMKEVPDLQSDERQAFKRVINYALGGPYYLIYKLMDRACISRAEAVPHCINIYDRYWRWLKNGLDKHY